jgi:hypothetical protein
MLKNILSALFFIVICSLRVFGLGLSASPAAYNLENLKIGQVYDVSKMSKPISIRYTGDSPMDIFFDFYKPSDPREGYEVIPDTSWLQTDKLSYTALPGEDVQVYMILSIPNDEQYFNKKYDARMRASLRPRLEGGAVGAVPAVEIKVNFTIFGKQATANEAEAIQKAIEKIRNISLSPTELFLENVPLGKTIDPKSYFKKNVKLSNVNDEPAEFDLRLVTPKEAGLESKEYADIDDASALKLLKKRIKIRANSVQEIPIRISIPDNPKNKGKKYLFIVEAAITGEALTSQYRSRIFITTK